MNTVIILGHDIRSKYITAKCSGITIAETPVITVRVHSNHAIKEKR